MSNAFLIPYKYKQCAERRVCSLLAPISDSLAWHRLRCVKATLWPDDYAAEMNVFWMYRVTNAQNFPSLNAFMTSSKTISVPLTGNSAHRRLNFRYDRLDSPYCLQAYFVAFICECAPWHGNRFGHGAPRAEGEAASDELPLP